MMDSIDVKVARLEERFDAMEDQLTLIGRDVREVRDTIVRNRGFAAGASLVVSAIWAAVIVAWNKWT